MNKKYLLIFCFSMVAVIFGTFGFIIGSNFDLKSNNPMIRKIVGVYYSDKTEKNESTLVLNADLSCEYLGGINQCKWSVLNDAIHIEYTMYSLVFAETSLNWFNSKSACIEVLNTVYNDIKVNSECVKQTVMKEITFVTSGVLIDGVLYKKID